MIVSAQMMSLTNIANVPAALIATSLTPFKLVTRADTTSEERFKRLRDPSLGLACIHNNRSVISEWKAFP